MAKITAISNQKGGVGKSTTAICLTQELQRKGYRTLIIDTDAQCNSTDFYGAKTDGMATMMDILCGDEPAESCIQHTEKGDIIPADPELKNADIKVADDMRRFSHLRKSLKGIQHLYDHIIIDTPPQISLVLRSVLVASDWIIIPAEESGWSISGLMDFSDVVSEVRETQNANLTVAGILIVKSHERTRASGRIQTMASELAKVMNTEVFHTRIREAVACREALTEYMVPLYEYAPKSTTQQDYEKFTQEFLARVGDKENG